MEFRTDSMARINGETELVNNNKEDLKDGVTYFRGGHHGSNSSNSQYFASVIRPQYVFWSNGGQSKGYDFPRTTPIINMGRYTDRIFVSAIDSKITKPDEDNVVKALHGWSIFSYDPKEKGEKRYFVDYENSNNQPDSLFLTDLLNYPDERKVHVEYERDGKKVEYTRVMENREYAFHIYNLTSSKIQPKSPIDCTYVKIGHIDILFGAGCEDTEVNEEVVNKIKYLCNDKVLDYVIVPSCRPQSYSYLVGANGLFSNANYTFKNIIYRDAGDEYYTNKFINFINDKKKNNIGNKKKISDVLKQTGGVINIEMSNQDSFNSKFSLNFLNTNYLTDIYSNTNAYKYSIATLLKVVGKTSNDNFTYLHLGSDYSYGYDDFDKLNKNYFLDTNILKNNKVDVLQMPSGGTLLNEDTAVEAFYDFVSKITKTSKNNSYANSDSSAFKGLKPGLTIMCNGTMYKMEDGTYKYPANISYKHSGYSYNVPDVGTRNLLVFVNQKMVGESGVTPYLKESTGSGDMCMRITLQTLREKKANNYYTKITYGINHNYAYKLGSDYLNYGLFFCKNVTDNFSKENLNYGNYDTPIQLVPGSFA